MKWIILWNIMVFLIYGFDKRQSIRRKRRVYEELLLIFAGLMGGFGALLGMVIFRHKTRKTKFVLLVSLFVLVQTMLLLRIYK